MLSEHDVVRVKKLKDLCSFQSGGTPSRQTKGYFTGTIPWVTTVALGPRYIDDSDAIEYISENAVNESATKLIPKHSLLFGNRVGVGKVSINTCEICTNQDIVALTQIDSKCLPEYLYYYLRSKFDYFNSKKRGATIQGVTTEVLKNLDVSLPPLELQKRVVMILEKAEKAIAKRKKADRLTNEYLQSVFIEMFGDMVTNPKEWERKRLLELIVGTPQNGLYKPGSDYTSMGGTPILRIDSFYDGKIVDLTTLKRVRLDEAEVNRYLLNNGDVVINRVNSIEYLGKCALVCNLVEDTVFESNMMRIKVNHDVVDPVYLTAFLCTKYVYNQILKRAKKAVNQASINQKDVSEFEILVPPLEVQKRYAIVVSMVEKLKIRQKKSWDELDILFKSLMQKAFRGELK